MRFVKYGCLMLLAVPLLWSGLRWFGSLWTETVASGEKHYPYGVNKNYGYRVDKYRLQRNGFRVHIWAGGSLAMTFDVPSGMELIRVKSQRWLLGDRVLLLEIDYVYHDSIDTSDDLGLLYDFETGDLRSYGQLSGWFVWPPEGRNSRKASKEEFHRYVDSLTTTAPAAEGVPDTR